MELRVVLLLGLYTWGITGKPEHKELRGEHPDKEDIDNGVCIPIPCNVGVPPKECKRLCDLRNYETICQPPADFCLCHHKVDGKMVLVSPDEITDQPPDPSEVIDQKPSKVVAQPMPTLNGVEHLQAPEVDQPQEHMETENDGFTSFQIFAVFLPIKQFLHETPMGDEATLEPTADTLALGYETVNVHDGRLFWDFRYILTGLFLLMLGLVLYELVLCAMQVYGSKNDLSVQCEQPEVKVTSSCTEKVKILNL